MKDENYFYLFGIIYDTDGVSPYTSEFKFRDIYGPEIIPQEDGLFAYRSYGYSYVFNPSDDITHVMYDDASQKIKTYEVEVIDWNWEDDDESLGVVHLVLKATDVPYYN